MDQTPKYLEMCSKLPSEIKNLVPRDHYGCMGGDKSFFGYHKRLNGLVWLPRQDQLQDMITIPKTHQNKSDIMHKVDALNNWMHRYKPLTYQFNSGEQLWLAFVMYAKYSKKWDGKEWI